jgi:hypothetical protein
MQRRELLKYTGLVLGVSATAGTLVGLVSSCNTDNTNSASGAKEKDDWMPTSLSPEQFALLGLIADTMLPKTKTPSASELKVDRFVDALLTEWYAPDNRQIFMNGLDNFNLKAGEKLGKSFSDASDSERTEYLNALNAEVLAALKTLAPEAKPLPSHQFFLLLKDAVYKGFFANEQLCTEILVYDPIPGVFKGCTALQDTKGLAYAPI